MSNIHGWQVGIRRGKWQAGLFRRSLCALALMGFSGAVLAAVPESAREIPVACEVDVAVVGGSAGAVSAAVTAAQKGARVFLLAPRPYLGEDMCATLRLWLEEGETPNTPLAQALFAMETTKGPGDSPRLPANALPFRYTASLPSASIHKDTAKPSLLSDGQWGRPENQSVQYDGDVVITADLGAVTDVRHAQIILYGREGSDFNPAEAAVSTSADGKNWKRIGRLVCLNPSATVIPLSTNLQEQARFVQFEVKRGPESKRVLVGEIILGGPEKAAPEPIKPVTPAAGFARLARPLHVKKTLDDALLAAKVSYLYSCYPTEVLRDAQGNLGGLVMANRSGRQAVLAKVIIDATPRAVVARMAGARFQPYPIGDQTFQRVVVGGEPVQRNGVTSRKTGLSYRAVSAGKKGGGDNTAELIEYTLRLPMADGSWAAFAEAEQKARDLTWNPAQLDASETLFQVPPDPMQGLKKGGAAWSSAAALDLDAFRPAGVSRLLVLGGCADLPREVAARLLRPLNLMEMGARVGAAAADEAAQLPAPRHVTVKEGATWREPADLDQITGELKESLQGLRPMAAKTSRIASPARGLPVLGVYDVVVIGGGTGGAPAGIGAGRGKAKTLLVEYLHGLGGVGTLGMISKYYHGYRGGFTAEVDKGVASLKAANGVVGKTEWWRKANREAGVEIWFETLGCGALVEKGLVKGVILATPAGRGVVLAKTVIDSTGNADVAAAAGAACDYTGADDVGVQGTGLPPLNLGAEYTNTDYTFADDTDVVDFWHLFVLAKQKFTQAHDLGQLVDTRERRRIIGDVTISPMDIILCRTWPDSVNFSMSNFDSHGFTTHPLFVAMPPDRKGLKVFVPLRALLPKGLDGILVTGLGVSAHRDAMPVIRMQPDVQNQGYACGRAAAMVAHSAATIRQVDIKELQKHLVETGCLPEQVLTDKDNLPLSPAKLAAAVQDVVKAAPDDKEVDGAVRNREALAMLFAQPQDSVPLLEKAHAAARGDAKVAYAHILAMMGSAAGAETLLARIRETKTFDKGWDYKGMGQFGRSLSELDSQIVALGRTRHPGTLDAVLEKLALLDASKEFSHHRACAMALETLADPRACRPLADLLKKPGMSGFATVDIADAKKLLLPSGTDNKQRNDSLKELVLARALYRCGDWEGLGEKILRQYAQDLRGHYARHASAVLAEGKPRR